MKKLLTNLLLAVLLNTFISAAPSACSSLAKVSGVGRDYISATQNLQKQDEAEFEIYPLDILAFKFH